METDFRSSFGLDLDPIFDSRAWAGRHWAFLIGGASLDSVAFAAIVNR